MGKIAIVGSGLASAYAVLACAENDIVPTVYAKEFVHPVGAVFLRWLPENLSKKFERYDVSFSSVGDRETYITKQWIDYPLNYESSFPENEYHIPGYDPNEVLSYIFKFSNMVKIQSIDHNLSDMDLFNLRDIYKFDFVFYSFPSFDIMNKYSRFLHRIFILEEKNYYPREENYIVYNGEKFDIRVRESTLFGKRYTELSQRVPYTKNELEHIFSNCKINEINDISPNCPVPDIQESSIIPIGRAARMDRSILAEDSYSMVLGILKNGS